jgi:hypothetical protein
VSINVLISPFLILKKLFMEMILSFFDEKIIKTQNIKLKFLYRINTWKFKRLILNVLWGLLNISVLFYGTKLMFVLNLELLWLAFVLLYATCYWIILSILLDKLIGDEIDNA